MHTCPMVTPGTPPVPHVGGPIMPPGAMAGQPVLIGGQPAARMGDLCTCVGPPDPIVIGAFPVPIGGKPAARMSDQTAHGGVIVLGLPTVLIGLAGTAGNVFVGNQMCNAAASGRTSGGTNQTYNNCGVESSRQVINQATGGNVTENGLLSTEIANGNANGTPGAPLQNAFGGTGAGGRQAILANNGVPSTVQATNATNIGSALSNGQGVIVNLDAAQLWPTTHGINMPAGSLHAVTVTGITYDDAGNVVSYTINDTGPSGGPNCGVVVPAATFNAATGAHPNTQLNVTTNPIF